MLIPCVRMLIGRNHGQAGVCCRSRVLVDRFFLCPLLHAYGDRSGHELIHQLVQAGMPAQVLHAGAQPVARVPPAQPQFSALLGSNEPMVVLLLFRCADVA